MCRAIGDPLSLAQSSACRTFEKTLASGSENSPELQRPATLADTRAFLVPYLASFLQTDFGQPSASSLRWSENPLNRYTQAEWTRAK
jgi:hypothetical protein